MIRIDQLRVDGFKPINKLEIEPRRLNIITGRNNSGKTSLLESIDILFNPGSIADFGSNINYLINSDSDECEIEVVYSRGQKTLSEFVPGGSDGRRRQLHIREPTDGEVIDYFYKSIYDILDLNQGYPISPSPLDDAEIDDGDAVSNIIDKVLRDEVSNLTEGDLLTSGAAENIVVVQIDENEYPFIHLGDYYDRIREQIVLAAKTKLMRKIENEFQDSKLNQLLRNQQSPRTADELLNRSLGRLLAPRFGRTRFVNEVPDSVEGIEFIRDVNGDPTQFDLNKENAAIRIQKIEEYLKNNIMDGLQDFSFDKIVIQDEYDKDPYEVPYAFLGEGVKIIVRILWSLLDEDNEGSVLLLEEPENHMHPGYVANFSKTLVDIAEKNNIQIYMTTHNTDLINSFFSPQIGKERQSFLNKNFRLIQLTNPVSKIMGYKECRTKKEELDLDLRGV